MIHRTIFRAYLFAFGLALPAFAQAPAEGQMTIWVSRYYPTFDNALHSELTLNGELINIFTSETFEPIEGKLKDGWNSIAIKTTPQEPATTANKLIFRVGPMYRDAERDGLVMSPVLWEFENGSDWTLENGRYSHKLGPSVKEVELSYQFYFTGLDREKRELKEGDQILHASSHYGPASVAWNSPTTATVFVNGTPLNTFLLAERQVIVTDLLKPGKNEIKLISTRVPNSIQDNEIKFFVSGPAKWNVQEGRYTVAPIVEFGSMQGWTRDSASGQLVNPAEPGANAIERTIPFILKTAPAAP